jgi:hypothetical protein
MVVASASPFIAQEFHLSAMTMGEVLSAFFLGYALMHVGGLYSDSVPIGGVTSLRLKVSREYISLQQPATCLAA